MISQTPQQVMSKNKYLFIGLVLIVVCIFTFLGYSYYSSCKGPQGAVSTHKPAPDNSLKVQNPSHSDDIPPQSATKTTPVAVVKTIASKQDYQQTETENSFYHMVTETVRPKDVDNFEVPWIRKIYRAFPPRPTNFAEIFSGVQDPETQKMVKQNSESLNLYDQRYQDMIMFLGELVSQCPDSPFYKYYQETLNLIAQMQREDKEFYGKYTVSERTNIRSNPDVHYSGITPWDVALPLNERIGCYIHCLRYSLFYKTERYEMEFGNSVGETSMEATHSRKPLLSGAKLVGIGVPAVPVVLNILEDRRPIIAVDEDKIPSRFYRYQDAAVEILQRMFPKAERPFPIEIPEGEYFSEYLEKQTPQERQNTINYIKKWVEETLNNPVESSEKK